MAKLKQKEWFTLADAAKYLTDATQEPDINEADIVQYALDEDLTISVRINRWTENDLPLGVLQWEGEAPDFEGLFRALDNSAQSNRFLKYKRRGYVVAFEFETEMPPGTYDIANDDDSNEIIADLWINLKEGNQNSSPLSSTPTLINESGDSVRFCRHISLIVPEEQIAIRFPDYLIPSKSYFVVRKTEIDSLLTPSEKKPSTEMSTKEKKNYLRVIRALCDDHKDIDLRQHSTADVQLIAMADALGLNIPSKRTLETLLKEARDLED